MARAAAKQNETAGAGHNSGGLTSDQRHALALLHRRRYRALDEEKRRVAADLRNLGRVVKADLGENGLDQIKDMIAMETPEGEEKVRAKLKARAEAISWTAGDDGQLDMFNGQPKRDETQAFMDGKIAGMDEEPLSNPYGAGTADYEDYARGWNAGNKVITELLAEREKAAELIEGPGHDDGRDLDDEQEAA